MSRRIRDMPDYNLKIVQLATHDNKLYAVTSDGDIYCYKHIYEEGNWEESWVKVPKPRRQED